jgi:hypothetical protein
LSVPETVLPLVPPVLGGVPEPVAPELARDLLFVVDELLVPDVALPVVAPDTVEVMVLTGDGTAKPIPVDPPVLDEEAVLVGVEPVVLAGVTAEAAV